MGLIFSFFAVITLVAIVFIGVKAAQLRYLFGIVIPYAAFLTVIIGVIYRVLQWGRIPVPFRIPTTGGQEKSLPWIKWNKIDNPFNSLGVIIRMALEVLLFRSLFRNTKVDLRKDLRSLRIDQVALVGRFGVSLDISHHSYKTPSVLL
jgi:hypothetical protein